MHEVIIEICKCGRWHPGCGGTPTAIWENLIGKFIQLATGRFKTENINVILIVLLQKHTR
jgi:hypothetical protein